MLLLEEKIQRYISSHCLIPHRDRLLIVALSGGADSVALLAALTALGYRCVAAHCNFHLRGEESDRDEAYARQIARLLGAEFHITHFDVASYRGNAESPISVEMACRDLRYQWFEQLRTALGADDIAVAHHADDNTETMLLNLLRGCGISGVRGMQPRNDRHIIRPMLQCRRPEIEQYLRVRGIGFVTDSTNRESIYLRNRIRNNVIPCIRENFPGADDAFMRSLEMLSENEAFYRRCVEEKRERYTDADGNINLKNLIGMEPQARLLLYEWLKNYGATPTQADNIITSARDSGKWFNISGGYLLIDRGTLRHVTDNPAKQQSIYELFEITVRDIGEFHPVRDSRVAYFDADSVDLSELEVRTWQHGDVMEPFGMRGSRKLSDIFTDAKIPVDRKHTVPILLYHGTILWVAGIRASRHYPVTAQSRRFIELCLRTPD